MKSRDLTGQRFGRLTAVSFDHPSNQGPYWLFRCDCGNERILVSKSVTRGHTYSCGCVSRERRLKHGNTIGHKQSGAYRSWMSMRRRCTYAEDVSYPMYGGAGITVCEDWLRSFESFYKDMGPRPPGTTLDRHPNASGNYEPGNCRWATPAEQARNKRTTRLVTHTGVTLCMADWATRLGWSTGGMRRRLNTMPLDAALVLRSTCRGRGQVREAEKWLSRKTRWRS